MKNNGNINKKPGERLKEWRKRRGISQELLAEKSGYSKVHISYIENGKRRMTIEAARIFSEILEIREKYLMGYDNFATTEEYRFSLGNHNNIVRCITEIITESNYGLAEIESGKIIESFSVPYLDGEISVVEIDKWLITESTGDDPVNDVVWRCTDEKMESFFEDIRLYILFRLRQLIRTCEEATEEEYQYWKEFINGGFEDYEN